MSAKNPVLWAASRVPWWVPILYAGAYLLAFALVDGGDAFGERANLAALAVGLAILVLALVPRRVEVGAEGLRLSWLGATTVRYAAIARAAPHAVHDVMLTMQSGASLRLLKPPFGDDLPRAVLERLWTTLSVGAEERLADAERAILERGGRPVDEWTRSLAAIASAGGQYRVGMPLEKLWRVVENPAIGAELRAAAAVTLVGSLDDAARARLDELAATTVDEPLRVAFTRVARARDAADLSGALAEIGATAPRPSARMKVE